jgi:Fe-S-cluster containining protein
MSDVHAKAQLDALYAELPAIDCQRKCSSSCGPIAMSRVEWARIVKKKGYEPKATSITCPLLVGGLCSVYSIRPMICRLWGLVEDMRCPWGCEPERVLTATEAYDFLLRAEAISDPDQAEEIEKARQWFRDHPDLVRLSRGLIVPPKLEEAR